MKTKDTISNEQLDCLKAVQKINNEMHEKEGYDNHNSLLSMQICSYHFGVKLYLNTCDTEISLYNSSENDERIYYEKADKYETWYSFLKRNID
jgi:hypothetical protein